MAIVTTNSQNYSDIADAIRSKGISGTLKPREMANAISGISSGGNPSITDGISVTSRDAAGNPTAVTVYGSTIYPFTCGANVGRSYEWLGSTVTDFSFADSITELKAAAFSNSLGSNTDVVMPSVQIVGDRAFSSSAFKSVSLGASAVLGNEVFRQSSIPSITVACSKTEVNTSQTFRQWSGTSAVCGSVGNPWIVKDSGFLGATDAETITVFCTSSNVASNLRAIRNGAVNAAITLKASEDMTYDGIPYSEGDTIITSTVEE